jgi:hypothetical protein
MGRPRLPGEPAFAPDGGGQARRHHRRHFQLLTRLDHKPQLRHRPAAKHRPIQNVQDIKHERSTRRPNHQQG